GLTGTLPFASHQKLIDACPEVPPAAQDLLNACLQPSPAERPASALHAYRRLQEICSAAGNTSLTPEGIYTLGTGAGSEAPTLVVPSHRAKTRRRLLTGAVAAVLLGLSIWGILAFFPFSRATNDGSNETLLGISIGDSRDDLVAKFGKPERHWTGSPWQDNQEVLGLVVGPEDLEPESSWEGYESLTWSKEQICAVFKNNVV